MRHDRSEPGAPSTDCRIACGGCRARSAAMALGLVVLLTGLGPAWTSAQNAPDKSSPKAARKENRENVTSTLGRLAMRVRVVQATPGAKELPAHRILWSVTGKGTSKNPFTDANGKPIVAAGTWAAWVPLKDVIEHGGGDQFPAIKVFGPNGPGGKFKGTGSQLTDVVVEFEFSENGKPLKSFREAAPKGFIASCVIPCGELAGADANGALPAQFVARLQGLSDHVRARRERLEKAFAGETLTPPKRFGIIGELGGYAEQQTQKIIHSSHANPAILADELRTMRLLGINGLRGGGLHLSEVAGLDEQFRRVAWGGTASNPMVAFRDLENTDINRCTFDDKTMKPFVADFAKRWIEEANAAKVQEYWVLWDDEINPYLKPDHVARCPRCRVAFCEYLKSQHVEPKDLGKASWDEVMLFPIPDRARGGEAEPGKDRDGAAKSIDGAGGKAKGAKDPARAGKKGGALPATNPAAGMPATAEDGLRYYYTYRFLTWSTAMVFKDAARQLKDAGIRLYTDQVPKPALMGASLDWDEFYDTGANTAIDFETSSRDPRVWQFESYLADIAQSAARRNGNLSIACEIKPHRGAPEQRMMALVTRGCTVFEWYTYGPDYHMGDNFTSKPELIEKTARAAQFLGKAEDWLYSARRAGQAEVAFVFPRSSEIWGRAGVTLGSKTDEGANTFESAKWVYLALQHAHIPVEILTEQQLAGEDLKRFKAIYVVGPNLRRDAAAKVKAWVREGGLLWTESLGASRDEANQPVTVLDEMMGAHNLKLETWGTTPSYKGTELLFLNEQNVPEHATMNWDADGAWGKGTARAACGREVLDPAAGQVIARFSDGKPAVIERSFGKGKIVRVGFWAGLTYSAKVRRHDYDMATDFDPALRALITGPSLAQGVCRPVDPAAPLVEAVLLENQGRRCVALMNWGYRSDPTGPSPARVPRTLQSLENLRITLNGVGEIKSIRSLRQGALKLEDQGAARLVTLPKMEEIDVLIIEE